MRLDRIQTREKESARESEIKSEKHLRAGSLSSPSIKLITWRYDLSHPNATNGQFETSCPLLFIDTFVRVKSKERLVKTSNSFAPPIVRR